MDSMTTIKVLRQEVYDAAYRYYMDLRLNPSKTPNTYFIYAGVERLAKSILRGGSRHTYPDMLMTGWTISNKRPSKTYTV